MKRLTKCAIAAPACPGTADSRPNSPPVAPLKVCTSLQIMTFSSAGDFYLGFVHGIFPCLRRDHTVN
jgi:hypothetical protein